MLGLLPLGEIANETGEEAAFARRHLADFELHGKGRSVLALATDHPIDADDALLAGCKISCDIEVMILAVGRGHEQADVTADHRRLAIAKETLRRGAEGLNDAVVVDDDGRVRDGV